MKKLIVLISGSGTNLEAISKACAKGRINGAIESVISNIQMLMVLKEQKKIIYRIK